ncbi:ABC transporter permease [Alienimonas californiensis]|uniref:ABC-2 family transporter protein n=1 Tax=Alienimonas californiensis TaxID=2527989 RepID=A0A517PEJ2_9PLAN|nr:ABC transporter permease [Alienimonas californiensis]QDT17781.1 ABC-2 family transporter protein [Alienimonas californiensis]
MNAVRLAGRQRNAAAKAAADACVPAGRRYTSPAASLPRVPAFPLLTGPIFLREARTAPRSVRHFVLRAGYVLALFVLLYTAEKALVGLTGDLSAAGRARFGALAFQLLATVQLTLCLFFALLFAAGNVAQEKDRRTLILLLMTDLRSVELVLGKLAASLLGVAALIACGAPVFFLLRLAGGVSVEQIVWSLALCAAASLAAGTWGSLCAFWREKTFQSLALGVLGLVGWLAATEATVRLAGPGSEVGRWAAALNPFRGLLGLMNPAAGAADGAFSGPATVSALEPVAAMTLLAAALGGVTVWRLRAWNPTRHVNIPAAEPSGDAVIEEAAATRRSAVRPVWANPVLWREIRTRAYGRKAIFIKLAFVALCAAAAFALPAAGGDGGVGAAATLTGLGLLGLILVNAQAVTALTTERDGNTLELLLATDLSAREFTLGKLGGVLFNTKEVLLAPLIPAVVLLARGALGAEDFVYLVLGYAVLAVFCAALGLHAAAGHASSRRAIAHSLGTVFFLSLGLAVFWLLLIEARSNFFLQFQSFLLFIGFGSVLLLISFNWSQPSNALSAAAFVLPFMTFYAITAYLLNEPLGCLLAVGAAYGFAAAAMLVPAVSEFGVTLGGGKE